MSKFMRDIPIDYKQKITYSDERGQQILHIKGKLDIRVFEPGAIHCDFWPDYKVMKGLPKKEIRFNIKDLLTLDLALALIEGVNDVNKY